MHRTTLISALALALASRVAAQGLDSQDIAPNCASVCSNIVTVSDQCERDFDDDNNDDNNNIDDDDDRQVRDCICNSQGFDAQIPECEACQRQYYRDDDDYDDIRSLLSQCGFSSVSATGSMTGMGPAPTGYSTTIITSTYTETDDDGDDDDLETTTITSVFPTGAGATTTTTGGGAAGGASNAGTSATGAVGSAASSAADAVGSAGSSAADAIGSATGAAGGAAEQSGNFAPAITAAPVLAAAGLAAAVLGL